MRLALLSDIHEDIRRLERILKKIEKKGCDSCICLGDISGYSEAYYRYPEERNASACLELLRDKCDIIIPGNHDLHAAGRIPEKPAGTGYDYWPHEADMDPEYKVEDLQFLEALPLYKVLQAPGCNILLSHYIEPNLSGLIQGFYTLGKEFASHFELMQKLNCSLGFSGHAHARGFHVVYPGQFRHYGYRRLRIRNFPAVVGIPPVTRNKNRSGFCIFDTNNYLLQVYKLY